MIPIKKITAALCLISLICIGSAFVSISEEAKATIFSHDDEVACDGCHASWIGGGTGTLEDYIAINHQVEVSFFENYIAENEEGSNGVDMVKLTAFIDSI